MVSDGTTWTGMQVLVLVVIKVLNKVHTKVMMTDSMTRTLPRTLASSTIVVTKMHAMERPRLR